MSSYNKWEQKFVIPFWDRKKAEQYIEDFNANQSGYDIFIRETNYFTGFYD